MWTDREGRDEAVAFRDFANARKKDVVGLLGSACSTCVCGATKEVARLNPTIFHESFCGASARLSSVSFNLGINL